MTAHYVAILPLTAPSGVLGLDDNKRSRWSFNVQALKRPSSTFVSELVARLSSALGSGVLVVGGLKAAIPPTGRVAVVASTTTTSVGTHSDGRDAYRRAAAMVVVHAESEAAAESVANTAFAALVGVGAEELAS